MNRPVPPPGSAADGRGAFAGASTPLPSVAAVAGLLDVAERSLREASSSLSSAAELLTIPTRPLADAALEHVGLALLMHERLAAELAVVRQVALAGAEALVELQRIADVDVLDLVNEEVTAADLILIATVALRRIGAEASA